MKPNFLVLVLATLTTFLSPAFSVFSQANPTHLQCEYLENPLGIDSKFPRLSWQMDDPAMGASQVAYQIKMGVDSVKLSADLADFWDSHRIGSSDRLITYSGPELKPFTKYYWKVILWNEKGKSSVSRICSFETGFMNQNLWKGNWISDGNDRTLRPAPYFRKAFSIEKNVKSARAYIAVAGLYDLYIDGKKVGNHSLDPMFTRYDRRTLYVTYDVSDFITKGEHAIGVLLGNGWYNHQASAVWFFDLAPWRSRPTFCLDMRIEYADGSVSILSTDTSWKTSTGALIYNNIYTGEHWDNRLEQTGWNLSGFDDSKWKSSSIRSAPSNNIVSQMMVPIRHDLKLPAISCRQINDTTYVFDLGRNISGVCEFNVKAPKGTVFRLKHGERLLANGLVDQSNIIPHYRPKDNTEPFQTDIFITAGKENECFLPRFSYKGFRYVEVTCSVPCSLKPENLSGYFMHSDVAPHGRITTSNEMINDLWKATNSSYLSNLFGYPTDCPQREKNGWTGDAHIAIETGLYNYDGITVYEKWMADHRDEQQPNGTLPAIVPTSGWGYQWANGPDWTSTIAIIPWQIYQFYGDPKLLADCYENIKRYVDHIDTTYPTGLTSWGLGDWIPVKSVAPVELVTSTYYYTDASILAKAALILKKKDDYKKYSSLAEKIKNAINDKYLDASSGIYGKGTQTELSLPLFWGVAPETLRKKIADNLANRVIADGSQLDVGLLGTKTILNALSLNGYGELAWKIASRETFPSWGWWIKNGATTLYENWPIDAGSDASLNHIMFGEVGAWMYKALGGIFPDPNAPGFKNVLLKPFFPANLDKFESEFGSPYGKIVSSWSRVDGKVHVHLVIPANATASLTLPTGYFIENKKPPVQNKSGEAYKLTSGQYEFTLGKMN